MKIHVHCLLQITLIVVDAQIDLVMDMNIHLQKVDTTFTTHAV